MEDNQLFSETEGKMKADTVLLKSFRQKLLDYNAHARKLQSLAAPFRKAHMPHGITNGLLDMVAKLRLDRILSGHCIICGNQNLRPRGPYCFKHTAANNAKHLKWIERIKQESRIVKEDELLGDFQEDYEISPPGILDLLARTDLITAAGEAEKRYIQAAHEYNQSLRENDDVETQEAYYRTLMMAMGYLIVAREKAKLCLTCNKPVPEQRRKYCCNGCAEVMRQSRLKPQQPHTISLGTNPS